MIPFLADKKILHLTVPWIMLFLVLNTPYYQDGDVNAFSRYATMRAMTMEQTFSIDEFAGWTMDWSKSPNGHYYSNKAPGPMFIGYPLFWIIDQVKLLTSDDFKGDYKNKLTIGYEHKVLIPLLLQMVPLCLLVLVSARYLAEQGADNYAIVFTTIALLFGNTAALFMPTWFGHGLTACLLLAMFFSYHYKKFVLLGLSTGFAILSDYSITLILIPTLIYLITKRSITKEILLKVLSGSVVPAILWIWYHSVNFGGPFSLPNMYQNPIFGGDSLANQFQFPNPYFILVLLFGDQRGILYTQPWVMVILFIIIHRSYFLKSVKMELLPFVALFGFVLLLIMNSAFVGWHGGSTPGPRYLSAIFPLFAVVSALHYKDMVPWERHLLWLALGVSVTFGGLVYGTTILAHEYYTVWTWLLDYLTDGKGSWNRILIFLSGISLTGIYTFYSLRRLSGGTES